MTTPPVAAYTVNLRFNAEELASMMIKWEAWQKEYVGKLRIPISAKEQSEDPRVWEVKGWLFEQFVKQAMLDWPAQGEKGEK